MPFDGNGNFTPSSPSYPAVAGGTITAAKRNALDLDFADGLTNCITRDGQSPPTANLPMGSFKLTGLAAGANAGDSLRYEQRYEAIGGSISGRAYTAVSALAFSATPTFDASLSNTFSFGALTANVTSCTVSNATHGQTISIRVVQDATGGRTFAVPAGAKIGGGVNLLASGVSWLTMTYVGGSVNRWEGFWNSVPA